MDYSHVLIITGSRDWTDEKAMRAAFRSLWESWRPVTRALLISGNAARGADATAERVWGSNNLDMRLLPADWNAHGKRAGYLRNQLMVDEAVRLRETGSTVAGMAFLMPCTKKGCTIPGPHMSHGTTHCRSRMTAAGIEVTDVA